RNLRGWLLHITRLTVSDHRRRAWFKNLFSRRSEIDVDGIRSETLIPSEALERKQRELRVHRLLSKMSEKRRVAFTLFEINGYTGEEIAELLQIPLKTVWTRLHYARKDFIALVEKDELVGKR